MFTLLKVVGELARSPTTFVMITNQKCQLYHKTPKVFCLTFGVHVTFQSASHYIYIRRRIRR